VMRCAQRCCVAVLAFVLAGWLGTGLALAQTASPSGLPLPRFVSLRAEEVNLRSGPGVRYPIDWVITKRDLPVEIIAEFDTWRKIRDHQGSDGWVHQTMLTGRRTVLVSGPAGTQRRLRRTDKDDAASVAVLEAGVIGRLLQCPRGSEFCRIEVEGYQGWLRRDEVWGIYRGEFID